MADKFDVALQKESTKMAAPDKYIKEINYRINLYADKYNIQPCVIKKVILQESHVWFRTAGGSFKNVFPDISEATRARWGIPNQVREYGLMQVYPHYALLDGFNPKKIMDYDIDENIHAGVYHLRDFFNQMLDHLKKKGVTKWFDIFAFGIASYNAGVAGVKNRLVFNANGTLNYAASFVRLPRVPTQGYVTNMLTWDID